MSRLERPLDKDSSAAADELLYTAHEDDKTPNTLFDEHGKRRPLDGSDPSLTEEWKEYYLQALEEKQSKEGASGKSKDKVATKPTASPSGGFSHKDVCEPSLPCSKDWIEITLLKHPGGKRKDWWPSFGDKIYPYEPFKAKITDGPRDGALNRKAWVRFEDIPAGSCDIQFHQFFEKIDAELTDKSWKSAGEVHSASQPALKVTVVIQLSKSVACPGLPFQLTAAGTPSGGTYTWTASGGELVDQGGSPATTGATVFLRSFKADAATGAIPEHSATVDVTYTHSDGVATDSKPVKVHKIDFVVTDTTIVAGVTRANEEAGKVELGAARGVNTMVTDPKVQIKLDASCPQKTDCAKNYRVGWLQTVVSVDRRVRYTHTLLEITKSQPFPLRDGDPFAGPSPYPFYDAAPDFTGDNKTRTARHVDNPRLPAAWADPRPGAPPSPPAVNQQLRRMFFQIGFHAWLVVQNKEWSRHDLPGSFAYQKHFDWSAHLDVTVDMTKAVGSRCTPQSATPTIGAMASGKGPNNPSFMKKCSNELNQVKISPEPGI